MRIVMLGAPGAGKGTQAKNIAKEYDITNISTGAMFRDAIKQGTKMGKKANEYIEKGLLVPDDIVIGLVRERLSQDDVKKGFILDGFPRNIAQAESLKDILKEIGFTLDAVVNIVVARDELIERFSGRRVCEACGATFHLKYNPPKKENTCDNCQGELIIRADDQMDTVKERLKVYEEQTAALIDYYDKEDLLINVDGANDIDKVSQDIISKLEGKKS